jgi:hypothetical protein
MRMSSLLSMLIKVCCKKGWLLNTFASHESMLVFTFDCEKGKSQPFGQDPSGYLVYYTSPCLRYYTMYSTSNMGSLLERVLFLGSVNDLPFFDPLGVTFCGQFFIEY